MVSSWKLKVDLLDEEGVLGRDRLHHRGEECEQRHQDRGPAQRTDGARAQVPDWCWLRGEG